MKTSNELHRAADKVARLEAKLARYKKAVSNLMLVIDTDYSDDVDTVGAFSDTVSHLRLLNEEVEDQGI